MTGISASDLRTSIHVLLILSLSDELVVSVVVGKNGVGLSTVLAGPYMLSRISLQTSLYDQVWTYLVLEQRVNPSVVDTQGNQVDVLASGSSSSDGSILALEVRAEVCGGQH